MQKTNRTEDKV